MYSVDEFSETTNVAFQIRPDSIAYKRLSFANKILKLLE